MKKDDKHYNKKVNKLIEDEDFKQYGLEKKDIKKAVTNLLHEADLIAKGEIKAANFDDVFGTDD